MKHLITDDIGDLHITESVLSQFCKDENFALFINNSVGRYLSNDWGDLPSSDSALNDSAVKTGNDRILAKYIYLANPELSIYIITEQDRSSTTIMFTDEY